MFQSLAFNFRELDWRLNAAVLVLMFAGLASLASVSFDLFQKQLWWGLLGFVFVFLIVGFDWRPFINYRGAVFGVYFLIVALLVLTLIFAPVTRGIRGWLVFGGFRLQASEFVKPAMIVLYAYFFSRKHVGIARIPNLLTSAFYFSVPAALVALQPDLGSVLVIFSIWFGFLLVSGIRWRHLAASVFIFLAGGVAMWRMILETYQKERILGLFFPERDPLGINYGVIQAKIAIGSAGLFGKGFGQGTQSQFGFLPEAQTDFIFAAFVEEWGLLMGTLVIAALTFLVLRIIKIGLTAENNFNRFVCLGTAILFGVQFFLNIGSNLGLTPVIGVTFPFLSYGGSSLLTDLILVGIIQSVFVRRK